MYGESTSQTDMVVDLDQVAKWLGVRKQALIKTLHESYKKGIDYIDIAVPRISGKHGGQLKRAQTLTPDCFKRLCMRSRSKKAEDVRTYFIQLEALVIKYREQLMAGMQEDMQRLERNQAGPSGNRARAGKGPRPGYIYALRASERADGIVKIGKAVDLRRRLGQHNASRADDVEVLYAFRTDDIDAMETCVKAWMKDKRYRKHKEIYKADLDMIKAIIDGCDGLGRIKAEFVKKGPSVMTGGYYVQISPDAAGQVV